MGRQQRQTRRHRNPVSTSSLSIPNQFCRTGARRTNRLRSQRALASAHRQSTSDDAAAGSRNRGRCTDSLCPLRFAGRHRRYKGAMLSHILCVQGLPRCPRRSRARTVVPRRGGATSGTLRRLWVRTYDRAVSQKLRPLSRMRSDLQCRLPQTSWLLFCPILSLLVTG
jgi:hypothetical protein